MEMIKKIAIVLAIGILALFLRWYAAVSLPTDYDEPLYYKAAQAYADAIRCHQPGQILGYSYNLEHPVLAKLVYGFVLAYLPPDNMPHGEQLPFKSLRSLEQTRDPVHIVALRKISVGFGTFQVIVLALFSPLAALLLAVHSMAIKYTSVIYLEALPAWMSTTAVFLLYKTLAIFRRREALSLRSSRWEVFSLVISATSLGIALAAKYMYAIVGVAIAAYWLILIIRARSGRWGLLGLLLGWGMLVLVVFLLADPYLWPDPAGRLVHSISYNFEYSQSEDVLNASYPFYQPIIWLAKSAPDHPSQAIPAEGKEFLFQLDTFIALLAVIGLPRLGKKHPLMLTWLVIGLVFLLIWKTKWPQYILIIAAPLCIAAAEGIKVLVITIWSHRPRKSQ